MLKELIVYAVLYYNYSEMGAPMPEVKLTIDFDKCVAVADVLRAEYKDSRARCVVVDTKYLEIDVNDLLGIPNKP